MPDYGHDLLFGVILTPPAIGLAVEADRAGLDLVSVPDHPYEPALLDAWTVLSVIAARTARVRVLPNVANLPLRPPAMLARAAASLDVLSGGRVELGLGAGAYWDRIAAQGGPTRTPGEAVAALGEAIAVIRALWTPGPAYVDGVHHPLAGAAPGPFPPHDIALWVGAIGPRMLRLIGRAADGWLPSSTRVPPSRLGAANEIIDDAATAAGRAPAAIRRLYNVVAPLDGLADRLAELTLTHGTSAFLLPADAPHAVRHLAEEVAPRVRELVAAERG